MNKIIIQGLVLILLFFLTWFALTKIDWTTIIKVQETADKTEEKLGELFWEIFQNTEIENKNPFLVSAVDSIVTEICLANKIDRELIKVHIFDNDDINAFALPNGHLLIYSGLILASENQEELSGVICHEIAHIKLNHVMKKLVKEVGRSVLISMTTGNVGAVIIKNTAELLASSAFDKSLEKDADIKAVEYLINTKINPEPFADFLYKLSEKGNEAMKYPSWASTHPDSKERAEYIIEYCRDKKTDYKAILTLETWDQLKERLQE